MDHDAALEAWTRAANAGHPKARARAISAYGANATRQPFAMEEPPERPASFLARICRELCVRRPKDLLRRLRGDSWSENTRKTLNDDTVTETPLSAPLLEDDHVEPVPSDVMDDECDI